MAQTLIRRLILLFFVFASLAIGLLWLFLPLTGTASAARGGEILDAIPSIAGIALAMASALAFSWYGDGARDRANAYAVFGGAFGFIIFIAIGCAVYATVALPVLQRDAVYAKNRPQGQRSERVAVPARQLKDGIKHYYEARFDTAIDQLAAFRKQCPDNLFADWYLKAAQTEMARQNLLRNQPRTSTQGALFNRGYEHLIAGNYLLAIIEFERVLTLNPQHTLAKKHLAEARDKLRVQKAGTLANAATGGLKARIEQVLTQVMEQARTKNWRACLNLAGQVLLLDPSNPTATRYAGQSRDAIAQTDFLEDEVDLVDWLPTIGPVLVPTGDGRLLYADRLVAGEETLWLKDFWLLSRTNRQGLIRGRLAKLTVTNRLVIRDALVVGTAPGDRQPTVTPRTNLLERISVKPALLATAALVHSEGRTVDPLTIIRQADELTRAGLSDLPLWNILARQTCMPFTLFLLGAIACGTGWRFREQAGRRSSALLRIATVPVLAAVVWFLSSTLDRLLATLVQTADTIGLYGWAAIPPYIVLALATTFIALTRLIRR